MTYQEQPSIEMYYDVEGIPHKYFPDFRLNFKDGSELFIEIKPACYLATKAVRDKLQAIAKRFEEQGRRFRVLTEEDIRRQPLFSNLLQVHRSSKRAAQVEPDEQLVKSLSGGPVWTIENLVGQMLGMHKVLRLVRSNHLQLDLEFSLSDDSEVYLTATKGEAHGSFRI